MHKKIPQFSVFDCDRHVIEPVNMWQQYLDPEIYNAHPLYLVYDTADKQADRLKRYGIGAAVPPIFMLGKHPLLKYWQEEQHMASAHCEPDSRQIRIAATHPAGQLKAMEQANIAMASLLPTYSGLVVNHSELPPEASVAYAQAYNNWLSDYCSHSMQHFIPVGLISQRSSKTLLNQLADIVDRGWRAIVLRPEIINGCDFGHANYQEFWAECEEKNVVVVFHGGTHLFGQTAGNQRFTSRFALHACSHPMEAQMAFVSLLESGVLERHPDLRFAFMEAGASWIPHWLWRLDNICYPEFPSVTQQNIKMLPSEYFKRQCWVTIEPGEPCLRQVADMIGHKNLLFGSDFPHPDHLHLNVSNITAQISGLTSDEVSDILFDNGLDFYRFAKPEVKHRCENLAVHNG